ncbi:MAG: glycerate kinase [Deltaproteobacteria bacterium]|nr:glycerate kinase [Deltaproteobacteria bacterium]
MNPLQDMMAIYREAVRAVDPAGLIATRVKKNGRTLTIDNRGTVISEDLSRYRQVIILGIGKASARMAAAMEDVLGEKLTRGFVITKYGHAVKTEKIRVVEAGHPLPDENSLKGARLLTQIADEADENTLIIHLVSGGGSALFCLPADGISFEDKKETTRLLLNCGADIDEMNCVRKHLSRVKGGGLARIAYPARLVNLILSDVIGDRIGTIASGITAADPTTFRDALGIVRKFSLENDLPNAVMERLHSGGKGFIPETPKADDPIFEKTTNIILGNNALACRAAFRQARELGYNARLRTDTITGEASLAGVHFAAWADELISAGTARREKSVWISGGETTVTIRGPGKGGRSQEMALAFAVELDRIHPGAPNIYFLSAGTDGTDGPTDAAGAFVTPELLDKMKTIAATASACLAANDSYHFFEEAGGLFKTGPTYTNVGDIQILMVLD